MKEQFLEKLNALVNECRKGNSPVDGDIVKAARADFGATCLELAPCLGDQPSCDCEDGAESKYDADGKIVADRQLIDTERALIEAANGEEVEEALEMKYLVTEDVSLHEELTPVEQPVVAPADEVKEPEIKSEDVLV